MDDFDIAQSRLGKSAQRVVERAVEEARRRRQAVLTNEHLLVAFAQVEWDTFARAMRDVRLNPDEIVRRVEARLRTVPCGSDEPLRMARETMLLFSLTLHSVARTGRATIESTDLFAAMVQDERGVSACILRRRDADVRRLAREMSAHGVAAQQTGLPGRERDAALLAGTAGLNGTTHPGRRPAHVPARETADYLWQTFVDDARTFAEAAGELMVSPSRAGVRDVVRFGTRVAVIGVMFGGVPLFVAWLMSQSHLALPLVLALGGVVFRVARGPRPEANNPSRDRAADGGRGDRRSAARDRRRAA